MLHFSFFPDPVPDESLVSGVIVVPFFNLKCILVDIKSRHQYEYEFVAGRFEDGETAEQTAEREVAEESGGIVRDLYRTGYVLVHNDDQPIDPFPFPDSYLVTFAAMCESIHDDLRDDNESAGIMLCELETVPEKIANRYPEWGLEIWELAKKTIVF